jgi:hypothetical protein
VRCISATWCAARTACSLGEDRRIARMPSGAQHAQYAAAEGAQHQRHLARSLRHEQRSIREPRWRRSTPPLWSALPRVPSLITETNRIYMVLFGMHSRAFDPYLAAMDRILISVMTEMINRDPSRSCSARMVRIDQ